MRARSLLRFAPILALAVPLGGCPAKKEEAAVRTCCDQPKIPAGIPAFTIVADDETGPSDGKVTKLRAFFRNKTKRDEAYKSLQFLYVYAMKRDPSFEPVEFHGEIYRSEAEAKSGSGIAAKVWRGREDKGPKCDNGIKLELPEQARNAFDWSTGRGVEENLEDSCHLNEKKKIERFDDKFKNKPTFTVDEARHAVEVKFPYLEAPSPGGPPEEKWMKTLTFNSAMTYWAEFMSTMFRKADDLKELTYIGILDDEPVVKITATREQFEAKLTNVQEEVAAFAKVTFAKLGMHKTDDKGAQKEQDKHTTTVYKAALATLPKDAVTISPKLK